AILPKSGKAQIADMLRQPRVDQRGLGLVQEDACIRVDHRSDFREVAARQRVLSACQHLVRVSLPHVFCTQNIHAASLSVSGKMASSSSRQIMRLSIARMPRAN